MHILFKQKYEKVFAIMKTEIIEKLIKLNKKAFKNKEVPVSCVIVKNNKLISKKT